VIPIRTQCFFLNKERKKFEARTWNWDPRTYNRKCLTEDRFHWSNCPLPHEAMDGLSRRRRSHQKEDTRE